VNITFDDDHAIAKDKSKKVSKFVRFLVIIALVDQHFSECFGIRQQQSLDTEQGRDADKSVIGDFSHESEELVTQGSSEEAMREADEREATMIVSAAGQNLASQPDRGSLPSVVEDFEAD